MKNDKKVAPTENKSSAGSNPENKFKKGKGGVMDYKTITSATEKTKARSGRGLADEGTVVSYDEER